MQPYNKTIIQGKCIQSIKCVHFEVFRRGSEKYKAASGVSLAFIIFASLLTPCYKPPPTLCTPHRPPHPLTHDYLFISKVFSEVSWHFVMIRILNFITHIF